MAEEEPLKTQNNQNDMDDIDKQRMLQEAKQYSEQKMKIPKSKKILNSYTIISLIIIFVIVFVYFFVIFYRNFLFAKMGF
ncbi:MAG: hypothetical protein AB7E39_07875 [Endomicrobiaceae bacterium]